jgi:hypothetical protein
MDDVEAISRQIVKYRCTETEAAKNQGIEQHHWFRWKMRKKSGPQFATILGRVREENIAACLDTINAAGDEITISSPKGTITRPGDWRAKAWMAERVLAPERFGQQAAAAATTNNSVTVIALGGEEAIRRRVEQYCSDVDRLLPRPADALALPADAQTAKDQDQAKDAGPVVDVDPSPLPSAL